MAVITRDIDTETPKAVADIGLVWSWGSLAVRIQLQDGRDYCFPLVPLRVGR